MRVLSLPVVSSVSVVVAAALASLSATAHAADATDLPPRFRADISASYVGLFEQVGLEEGGVSRAIRERLRHDVDLEATVSVWKGLALRLALPITARQDLRWPGARAMRVDPLTGEGSYEDGAAIEPPTLTSRGLEGLWVGVAASPFRQGWANSLPVTVRLDLAVRTPAKNSTLYNERRGVAPGGAAIQVGAAFSRLAGRTDTWLSLHYTAELAATGASVVTRDGSAAPDQTVRNGDTLTARIGGVRIFRHDPRRGLRTGLGFWTGVDWIGESRRPSGYWLPDVLATTEGSEVVSSDRLAARFGVDFELDPVRQAGVRLGLDAAWLSPRVEEHVYPVATDTASWSLGWTVTVIGRVRLNEEPIVAGVPDVYVGD